MGRGIRASTTRARNTEKGDSPGLMGANIKVNSRKIISKVVVGIIGRTGGNTTECGSPIKWRATVSLNGRMVDDMKVSMSMIKNRGKVSSIGRMGANMMAVGKMGNNMDWGLILLRAEKRNRAAGRTERDLIGSQNE